MVFSRRLHLVLSLNLVFSFSLYVSSSFIQLVGITYIMKSLALSLISKDSWDGDAGCRGAVSSPSISLTDSESLCHHMSEKLLTSYLPHFVGPPSSHPPSTSTIPPWLPKVPQTHVLWSSRKSFGIKQSQNEMWN